MRFIDIFIKDFVINDFIDTLINKALWIEKMKEEILKQYQGVITKTERTKLYWVLRKNYKRYKKCIRPIIKSKLTMDEMISFIHSGLSDEEKSKIILKIKEIEDVKISLEV